jgi:hypothetical protein
VPRVGDEGTVEGAGVDLGRGEGRADPGVQQTVETRLFCQMGGAAKTSRPTVTGQAQSITSVGLAANTILAAHGHDLITEKTNCIPVDDPP